MAELPMTIRIEPEDIANRVLDEFEYKGKTIREWADGLANPSTQADRIRSLSDEELADVFDHVQGDAFLVGVGERKNSVYPGAGVSWLDWLKSPMEVEDF